MDRNKMPEVEIRKTPRRYLFGFAATVKSRAEERILRINFRALNP